MSEAIDGKGKFSVESVLYLLDKIDGDDPLRGECHRLHHESAKKQMEAVGMRLVTPQQCGRGEGDFMWADIPWKTSSDCPADEARLMRNGVVIGKILNLTG